MVVTGQAAAGGLVRTYGDVRPAYGHAQERQSRASALADSKIPVEYEVEGEVLARGRAVSGSGNSQGWTLTTERLRLAEAVPVSSLMHTRRAVAAYLANAVQPARAAVALNIDYFA